MTLCNHFFVSKVAICKIIISQKLLPVMSYIRNPFQICFFCVFVTQKQLLWKQFHTAKVEGSLSFYTSLIFFTSFYPQWFAVFSTFCFFLCNVYYVSSILDYSWSSLIIFYFVFFDSLEIFVVIYLNYCYLNTLFVVCLYNSEIFLE